MNNSEGLGVGVGVGEVLYKNGKKKPTWKYLDYAYFLQRHVYSRGQEAGSVKLPGVETRAGIQRKGPWN